MSIKDDVLQEVRAAGRAVRPSDLAVFARGSSVRLSTAQIRGALWSLTDDGVLVAMKGNPGGETYFGEQGAFAGEGWASIERRERSRGTPGVTVGLNIEGRAVHVGIEQARLIYRQLGELFGSQ